MFRHGGIYVNSDSGIAELADLIGRTVGVAEYQLTANVWIRGILQRYFAATGVFPIMHTVVLRRALYTEHRWLRSCADNLIAAEVLSS